MRPTDRVGTFKRTSGAVPEAVDAVVGVVLFVNRRVVDVELAVGGAVVGIDAAEVV